MLITNVPHGVVRRAEQTLWDKLGDTGGNVATAISTDSIFATRMALAMAREYVQPYKERDPVARIMGSNYLGRFEANFLLRIAQEKLQVPVPFSMDELRSCRDSHILCLVPPISTRRMLATLGHGFLAEHDSKEWLKGPSAVVQPKASEWHLIPRNYAFVAGSSRLVSARVLVYLLVMRRIANDERFGDGRPWLPTTDFDRKPYRIHFGWNDDGTIARTELSER